MQYRLLYSRGGGLGAIETFGVCVERPEPPPRGQMTSEGGTPNCPVTDDDSGLHFMPRSEEDIYWYHTAPRNRPEHGQNDVWGASAPMNGRTVASGCRRALDLLRRFGNALYCTMSCPHLQLLPRTMLALHNKTPWLHLKTMADLTMFFPYLLVRLPRQHRLSSTRCSNSYSNQTPRL